MELTIGDRGFEVPEAAYGFRTRVPGTNLFVQGLKPPNLNELRSAIRRARRLDCASDSFERFLMHSDPIFSQMRLTVAAHIVGETLYRARGHMEFRPEKVADFAAPPSEYVTRYQRCNRPKSPKFYCSSSYGILPYEIGCKTNDTMYVSEWDVVKPVKYCDLTPSSIPEVEPEKQRLVDTAHAFAEEVFQKRVMSSQSSEYKPSAAIAETFFTASHQGKQTGKLVSKDNKQVFLAAGYVSVAKWGHHLNLALSPDHAQYCLGFSRARELKVILRKGQNIIFQEIAVARPDASSGDLIWSQGSEQSEHINLLDQTHPEAWITD